MLHVLSNQGGVVCLSTGNGPLPSSKWCLGSPTGEPPALVLCRLTNAGRMQETIKVCGVATDTFYGNTPDECHCLVAHSTLRKRDGVASKQSEVSTGRTVPQYLAGTHCMLSDGSGCIKPWVIRRV